MNHVLLSCVFALSVLSISANARDRVVLQPPDKTSPLTLSGDIADYNAEGIEIHLTVGKPVHRYPISHVVSVQTVQTEAHRAGVKHFAKGDLSAAEVQFLEALNDEPRQWVKREILGWLIKIALRRGNGVLAGQRFLQIVDEESAPREYAVIPLIWGTIPDNDDLIRHGRMWLTGSTNVERLLGASVLLFDQRFVTAAKAEMDRLARAGDTRVAELARAQLWRLRLIAPDVTRNELNSWELTIQSLPVELRAGPYYLLGHAALQRSEYDRAAAAFLWLPTVYAENEPLTAQAAIGAATALQRIGRLPEARLLLQELNDDYSWSSAAAEARMLLSELDSSS